MIIKKAAILLPSGKVYTGKRHCDCFGEAAVAGEVLPFREVQGFVTFCNKFVDRREAARMALASGQASGLKFSKDELFSEDL